MYIPQDIWLIIKSYVFDYKKYIIYKKNKLMLEFHDKNKFWDIKNENASFWYDSVALAYKNSNLYSLDRVKLLCHYYNSGQYSNHPYVDVGFAFGPAIPHSSPNYKLPIFWTDNKKGQHPYFTTLKKK